METNSNGKGTSIGDFWEINSKNEVKISPQKLIEFCSKKLNYCNYIDFTRNYILVKVSRNSIIEEAKIETLKQEIKYYLKEIKKEGAVWEAFASRDWITKHTIDLLDVIPEINFNYSSKDEAYFYYRNGIVRITKDGCSMVSYEEFGGKVWKNQIVDRDFGDCNLPCTNAVFDIFLRNLSANDTQRYNSLKSILGYILHPYKDAALTKAVIFIDENIDFSGTANGATGKSILATAISNITATLWKDGKKYNPNESFVFDDVRPYHRVLYFDDVKRNFPFDEFFSLITSKMRVTRKYKDATVIPPKFAPKLLISSNYMVKGTGGDTDERRRLEFEIAPHYSISYTPRHEFGHNLFDEWDSQEWARFDVLMLRCVHYFMNNGVVAAPNINLTVNKVKVLTDPDFVTFMDGTIVGNTRYEKPVLLEDFRKLCPKYRFSLSAIEFKRWLDEWAKYKGLEVTHTKSNGKSYITFIESIVPEQG